MNVGGKSPADLMAEDLAKSGLTYQDMLARVLDEASREAVKATSTLKGYVIPYFNIQGKLTQYYRVKIFDNPNLKYLQLPGTPNHVYFPKNWPQVFDNVQKKLCVITEGEKKAALCTKMGIPAIAFSGVDSWQNRTLLVPKSAEIVSFNARMQGIKLPASNFDDSGISTLATGLQELIDIGLFNKTTFVVIFDRDSVLGTATGPQRSAARFGFELRFKGFHIKQIRQMVPPVKYSDKNGRATLEDILLSSEGGTSELSRLISENLAYRTTFPVHPSIREYIARQLGKGGRLERKQYQMTALSVITELDAKGTRMFSPDDYQMYYFNGTDNHLMKVDINKHFLGGTQESEFGQLMYKNYSISMTADQKLVQWIGTQFAGEEPLEIVIPYRIIGRPKKNEDAVRFQINNGQYIKVTGDSKHAFTILPNGEDSTLFESQNIHVPGIEASELIKELQRQIALPLKPWWQDVLTQVRLKNPGRTSLITSYLYYISPWLLRWRGMQLPIEVVTGEAGSGKSTLYEIRLGILTGDPKLFNSPNDLKDWYAALANCGGLHITDNVHMTDKALRQRISDELCRIVTEPDPRIRMRKYFTEADERSIRINAVFGFTAIQPPFQNSDFLQRSITLELSKDVEDDIVFDGTWKDKQISRFGGRTAWVAHHMIVLHRFFQLVHKKWDSDYQAKYRLINFEQAMMFMAEIFGQSSDWIPEHLTVTTNEAISTSDWAIEGLVEYAQKVRTDEAKANQGRNPNNQYVKTFTAGDIAAWAESHEDYEKCFQLANSRSCGRYMQANRYTISQIAGIVEYGRKNNRVIYRASPIATKEGRMKAQKDKEEGGLKNK